MKTCRDCGDTLPLSCFYERKSRPGHLSVCVDCMRTRWRKWNEAKRGKPAPTTYVERSDFLDMGPVSERGLLVASLGCVVERARRAAA